MTKSYLLVALIGVLLVSYAFGFRSRSKIVLYKYSDPAAVPTTSAKTVATPSVGSSLFGNNFPFLNNVATGQLADGSPYYTSSSSSTSTSTVSNGPGQGVTKTASSQYSSGTGQETINKQDEHTETFGMPKTENNAENTNTKKAEDSSALTESEENTEDSAYVTENAEEESENSAIIAEKSEHTAPLTEKAENKAAIANQTVIAAAKTNDVGAVEAAEADEEGFLAVKKITPEQSENAEQAEEMTEGTIKVEIPKSKAE
mmetsp:Transcript_48006/g.55519  ORF Transcript_48006/g.55519 Transcript_48006/m.55519 type:complete len:259 (+) Transcript_48006:34-810(+)|eukprot:CAMPEP_0176454414 /NCGR_PEP_ID=MMETSP0127-20121128/29947_1 /TAXON_ID=938130 /ORGANISM="Platyophrya macrostoma, Strain WH" /LENGTH=258 /DNA_ID=CAMNT_0017843715 /DNA_START=33 /DNA_END=809 /DNA_ORIENTATION=+